MLPLLLALWATTSSQSAARAARRACVFRAARLEASEATASLYDQLFRNKTVTAPLDPAFELNAARTELATSGSLSDHVAAIAAATSGSRV